MQCRLRAHKQTSEKTPYDEIARYTPSTSLAALICEATSTSLSFLAAQARAASCSPAAPSGSNNNSTMSTGLPSIAVKSIGFVSCASTPKGRSSLWIRACGMAIPSPRPVEPSCSRFSMASVTSVPSSWQAEAAHRERLRSNASLLQLRHGARLDCRKEFSDRCGSQFRSQLRYAGRASLRRRVTTVLNACPASHVGRPHGASALQSALKPFKRSCLIGGHQQTFRRHRFGCPLWERPNDAGGPPPSKD